MKTAIVPIVAVLAMGAGLIFKVNIGAEDQNTIAEGIASIAGVLVSIWGIWKNHKKGE